MDRRLRLGNAFGVDVEVDWSWVFTFVLAAWTLVNLGAYVLPGMPRRAVIGLGAGAALGLFASLAVHEIAHGLTARSLGVPVRRLTLFLFGGITDVERAPASPRTEAIAAVVAPLASAVTGALLLGAAAALGASALAAPPGGVHVAPRSSEMIMLLVAWLGGANVAIAAVNLLPAFPLDGGRLVRAAIWRHTGDVERATRWAAWLGLVIAWTLVLLGFGLAVAGHGIAVAAGMWLAFAGWFLASAASQAYEGVVVELPRADRERAARIEAESPRTGVTPRSVN